MIEVTTGAKPGMHLVTSMSAHADLRGLAKVTVMMVLVFGAGLGLLYLIGINLHSQRVKMLEIPVAATFGLLFLTFLWRVFWRLKLTDDSFTWHMLTRKYSLPITAITEIGSEVHVTGNSLTHVLVVHGNGGDDIRLETNLWKEDQLKSVIRALQQSYGKRTTEDVQKWLA